jgi:TrmH family RNA methyltransferase
VPAANPLANLRVVLVAPRNPLNIGAVARVMSNFGFTRLRVVNPYEVAFREAKSAVGAADLLERAEEFTSVADAVADCSLVVGTSAIGNRQPQHPVHSLVPASAKIRKAIATDPVALLFGSEKWGLSNDSLSHCHRLLHIPTRHEHLSMNLGHAVAVCLYEIARTKAPWDAQSSASHKLPPATSEAVERLTQTLLQSLQISGYINPRAQHIAEEKLRRLVRRLKLNAADAEVFLGMLHKILWKLQS